MDNHFYQNIYIKHFIKLAVINIKYKNNQVLTAKECKLVEVLKNMIPKINDLVDVDDERCNTFINNNNKGIPISNFKNINKNVPTTNINNNPITNINNKTITNTTDDNALNKSKVSFYQRYGNNLYSTNYLNKGDTFDIKDVDPKHTLKLNEFTEKQKNIFKNILENKWITIDYDYDSCSDNEQDNDVDSDNNDTYSNNAYSNENDVNNNENDVNSNENDVNNNENDVNSNENDVNSNENDIDSNDQDDDIVDDQDTDDLDNDIYNEDYSMLNNLTDYGYDYGNILPYNITTYRQDDFLDDDLSNDITELDNDITDLYNDNDDLDNNTSY